jgi:hypothetical protein
MANRAGRTPKGGIRRPVRFPDDQFARYEAAAAEEGISFSDWIANRIARAEGLDEPYPAPKRTHADTLPIGVAA